MGLSYRGDISQRGGEGFTHPSTNLQLPFWDCPMKGRGGGGVENFYLLNFHSDWPMHTIVSTFTVVSSHSVQSNFVKIFLARQPVNSKVPTESVTFIIYSNS